MSSQVNPNEQQKFAVFDIDGTLIRWQLYHAVVEELIKLEAIPRSSVETVDLLKQTWRRREASNAYQIYETAIDKHLLGALPNISTSTFYKAVQTAFELHKDQVYVYTRNLIKELRSKNYLIFAISGSHYEAVKLIGDYYKFDAIIGTTLTKNGDIFTGEEIAGNANKGKTLQQLVTDHNATFADSYAIGDSRSDASMLTLVDNPIAFNPDQNLFTIAKEHSWKIVIERKNMIYTLESNNGQYLLV